MKDFLLIGARLVSMVMMDVFWHLFFKPKGYGLENIPKKGGVLVTCNHLSNLDPMYVGYNVCNSFGRFSMRQIWNPAKEELFNIPVIGFCITLLRAFPVKRGKADVKSMEKITELARKNIVTVYPEGTRSPDGKLQKGKSAVGKIIHDSGATVVPAAVFNTQLCLPKGSTRPKFFVPISVVFGKPLDFSRYKGVENTKEISKAIIDEVMAAIANLQKEYAYLDASPK
ncbi:MAG: 1-acyl-sn-glycerol-3-phosphate acyltransferase [Nitrospinae bacterium]|nr:1-acyl-sn-glycerol-3-phosphate acyltransferase [Nitrospinota bacterium]